MGKNKSKPPELLNSFEVFKNKAGYPDLDLTEVKKYEGIRQYIKIKTQ